MSTPENGTNDAESNSLENQQATDTGAQAGADGAANAGAQSNASDKPDGGDSKNASDTPDDGNQKDADAVAADRVRALVAEEVGKAFDVLQADFNRRIDELATRIAASAPEEVLKIANEAKAAVDAIAVKVKHWV